MKTEWDYSNLAEAYLTRPDYADEPIDQMAALAHLGQGARVCDIGAGVGHLTLMLAKRGFQVTALEPNDNMRRLGTARCAVCPSIRYFERTAEETHEPSATYDCVTYGSSFNVTDRPRALQEASRILKSKGWMAAMWNHRELSDPIQAEIESIIARFIPDYGYGTRREDQSAIIGQSQLFENVTKFEGRITHNVSIANVVEAWRSHGTLHRQAGAAFDVIVGRIESFLTSLGTDNIDVPYTTRLWAAQKVV